MVRVASRGSVETAGCGRVELRPDSGKQVTPSRSAMNSVRTGPVTGPSGSRAVGSRISILPSPASRSPCQAPNTMV